QDVERQDVHVYRLELQQQRLKDCHVRILEEVEDAHFLVEQRIVVTVRDIGDLCEIDRKQEHVRHVDLPRPLEYPRRRHYEAMLLHGAAVDEGRRITGDEYEYFGRVAEAVVADGNPIHHIGWNVIEKYQPERKASEQIKPEIAFGRNRGHVRL